MQQLSFLHIRNVKQGAIEPRGGVTYAYRERDGGVVEFAVARCSKRDNFVKAYGRAKAAGRLASPDYLRTFNGTAAEFRTAVYDNAQASQATA